MKIHMLNGHGNGNKCSATKNDLKYTTTDWNKVTCKRCLQERPEKTTEELMSEVNAELSEDRDMLGL